MQLVQAALGEIGMSGYAFDLSSDQIASAVARLDALIAEWNGRGIRLGYPLSSSPGAIDANAESNLPDWAVDAVIMNLAIRLGPSYGKALGPDTKASARAALNTLLGRAAFPDEVKLNTLPSGAGAKGAAPFTTPDAPGLSVGPDAGLDFN